MGPNPTDRAKPGVKKSLLVEADGGPLAITIAGANVPDAQLLDATIEAVVLERPEPEPDFEQHLCLDKAYDNDTGSIQSGSTRSGRQMSAADTTGAAGFPYASQLGYISGGHQLSAMPRTIEDYSSSKLPDSG